jgi:hypothetical protein
VLGTSHRLYAIRNDFAGLEGETHSFTTHGNAVRDSDSVVLPAKHAMAFDCIFDNPAEIVHYELQLAKIQA